MARVETPAMRTRPPEGDTLGTANAQTLPGAGGCDERQVIEHRAGGATNRHRAHELVLQAAGEPVRNERRPLCSLFRHLRKAAEVLDGDLWRDRREAAREVRLHAL